MIKRKVTLTVDDEIFTYFSKYFSGELFEAVNDALEKHLHETMHRRKVLTIFHEPQWELGPPTPESEALAQSVMDEMAEYNRQAVKERLRELKAL
jgi:hypothetical protein